MAPTISATMVGSGNGLARNRHHTITQASADLLLIKHMEHILWKFHLKLQRFLSKIYLEIAFQNVNFTWAAILMPPASVC